MGFSLPAAIGAKMARPEKEVWVVVGDGSLQMTVQELSTRLDDRNLQVLDVRRQGEWDAGHIAVADWYPLDRFKAALPPVEPNATIAVHCKSGYRSMIACSLLQRAGHKVINVIGGFDAWQQAQLPTTAGAAAAVGA